MNEALHFERTGVTAHGDSAMERDTRTRLLEGLDALAISDHASDFHTAFYLLRLYVGGSGKDADVELGRAFARVLNAIEHRVSPR